MLEITNPERFGAFRIHRGSDVVPYGWVVVACVTTASRDSDYRDGKNYSYVMPGAEYVIGQLKDDTIAELAKSLDDARTGRTKLDADLRAQEVELKKLTAACENKERDLKTIVATLDKATVEIDRLKKLETDLAKVRTHFGQKAFDEAVSK